MNKNNVYVVGFPKSGNTWLARIISGSIGANIYSDVENDVINRSDYKKSVKEKDIGIQRVHWIDAEEKEILASKIVYIIRDPRDSFISGFYHNYRMIHESNVKKSIILKLLFRWEIKNFNKSWNWSLSARLHTLKTFAKNILRLKFKGIGVENVGNWSDHVNFWTSFDNVCLVRYEDLLANPESEVTRILNTIKIDYDINSVRNSIKNESFNKKKEEFLASGDIDNFKFLRKGKSGDWRFILDKKLSKLIQEKHYLVMKKYNYINE